LTNLLLISAAAALVVVLIRRYTASAPLAGAAGILFALHPYHVENAAWIAARPNGSPEGRREGERPAHRRPGRGQPSAGGAGDHRGQHAPSRPRRAGSRGFRRSRDPLCGPAGDRADGDLD
jgi:hypothetical protein